MKASYVFAAVVAVVGCTEATAPTGHSSPTLSTVGRGDMILNETTPLPVSPPLTACNGDLVYGSGTVHTMVEITTSPSGSRHTRATAHFKFTGVGQPSGATYVGDTWAVEKDISNSAGASVYELGGSGRLITQGKVTNTWVDFTTTLTINANGEMTHSSDTFKVRCQ